MHYFLFLWWHSFHDLHDHAIVETFMKAIQEPPFLSQAQMNHATVNGRTATLDIALTLQVVQAGCDGPQSDQQFPWNVTWSRIRRGTNNINSVHFFNRDIFKLTASEAGLFNNQNIIKNYCNIYLLLAVVKIIICQSGKYNFIYLSVFYNNITNTALLQSHNDTHAKVAKVITEDAI